MELFSLLQDTTRLKSKEFSLEILIQLIWTNVPRTNVAWTNVVMTVVICCICSQDPLLKVAIYSRYLVPSLRFHMAVHNIHHTQLDKLDQYLKSWLKIPANGVKDLSIFHPYMLGVKPPSRLYLEGHAGNYLQHVGISSLSSYSSFLGGQGNIQRGSSILYQQYSIDSQQTGFHILRIQFWPTVKTIMAFNWIWNILS